MPGILFAAALAIEQVALPSGLGSDVIPKLPASS
jgi:hypothetical protein